MACVVCEAGLVHSLAHGHIIIRTSQIYATNLVYIKLFIITLLYNYIYIAKIYSNLLIKNVVKYRQLPYYL